MPEIGLQLSNSSFSFYGSCCRPLLDRMHLGYFVSSSGAIRQRTETQAEQARLFEAIGVSEPPRFFQIDPRTSV